MRYWPIGLVVFGAALLGTQLWPLDADLVRNAIIIEIMALGVTAGLAMGERRG